MGRGVTRDWTNTSLSAQLSAVKVGDLHMGAYSRYGSSGETRSNGGETEELPRIGRGVRPDQGLEARKVGGRVGSVSATRIERRILLLADKRYCRMLLGDKELFLRNVRAEICWSYNTQSEPPLNGHCTVQYE